MAMPAFVAKHDVLNDATLNATPAVTANVTVSVAGHTLVAFIPHERANTSTPVVITGVARDDQTFGFGAGIDSGGGATNVAGSIWVLPNAKVGSYPLSITYTGSSGSDVQVVVLECDGGVLGTGLGATDANYLGSVSEAVARIDLTASSVESLLLYMTVNFVSGAVWTGPSHGTSRHTGASATGSAGDSFGIAEYAPGAVGEVTGIGYEFTPYAGSASNWPNLTVGIELVPETGLSGTASGSSSVTGTLTTYASLSGTAAGVASATGVLEGVNTDPIVHAPDQDAEIVNVASSSVTDLGGGAYKLTIAADDQADVTGWINIVARVTVKAGTTVTLEANLASHQFGIQAGGNSGWVYRLASETGIGGFTAAANRVLTASNGYIRGDLPTDDEDQTYLVALQPVWKEADYATWYAALAARAHAHEAASSIAASSLPTHVHARVSPGTRTQQNSVATADADLRVIRITNTGESPPGGKIPAVLLTGQHTSEHQGDYAWREWTDWLTTEHVGADETLRQALLRVFDSYALNVNPLGRRYGKERETEEAGGDEDPNRSWDNTDSAQVNAVRAAIGIDVGVPLVVIDFHGAASRQTGSWPVAFMFYATEGDPRTPFSLAVEDKLGGLVITETTNDSARTWAYGQGAIVSETAEYAMGGPGWPNVTYDVPNGAMRETLLEMYEAGYFGAFLEGMAAGSSTAVGTLTAYGLLSGTAAGTANVSGTLSGDDGLLSGAAQGTSSAVGTLTAYARLTGSVAGVSSANGALTARANLLGTASGSATAVGTLRAFARLSGTVAGVGSASGLLTTGDGINSPPPQQRRASAIGESRRAAAI